VKNEEVSEEDEAEAAVEAVVTAAHVVPAETAKKPPGSP